MRYAVVIFIIIFGFGCSGGDNSPTVSDNPTELQGTWDAIERDTNVDSVFVFNGQEASFDSQLTGESYSGTVSINTGTNPKRLDIHVEQSSETIFIGKNSLCIYSMDDAKTGITLACNAPGYGSYPIGFAATNLTRLFDLTKRTKVVTPTRLKGMWATDCMVGIRVFFDFTNSSQVDFSEEQFSDTSCSGSSIQLHSFKSYYSVGDTATATDANSTSSYTAYSMDLENYEADGISVSPTVFAYDIAYIDDNGVLYFGDTSKGLDGKTPNTRPNVIAFQLGFKKQ